MFHITDFWYFWWETRICASISKHGWSHFRTKALNGPTCLERQEALEDVVDKVHVSAFMRHTATCEKKKRIKILVNHQNGLCDFVLPASSAELASDLSVCQSDYTVNSSRATPPAVPAPSAPPSEALEHALPSLNTSRHAVPLVSGFFSWTSSSN